MLVTRMALLLLMVAGADTCKRVSGVGTNKLPVRFDAVRCGALRFDMKRRGAVQCGARRGCCCVGATLLSVRGVAMRCGAMRCEAMRCGAMRYDAARVPVTTAAQCASAWRPEYGCAEML